jgi:hypothetical protein
MVLLSEFTDNWCNSELTDNKFILGTLYTDNNWYNSKCADNIQNFLIFDIQNLLMITVIIIYLLIITNIQNLLREKNL